MIIQLIKNQKTLPTPIGCCIEWIDWIGEYIKTVAMTCPICGHSFSLRNHSIVDGKVYPSVVCPFNCGFHEFIEIK